MRLLQRIGGGTASALPERATVTFTARMEIALKFLRWSRRVVLSGVLLAPLPLGGCEDAEVHHLAAEELIDPSSPAAAAPEKEAPRFAPEDTATRTVAEAIQMRLAFVRDSLASAAVDSTAARDSAGAADSTAAPVARQRYDAGEDPAFARRMGWPVRAPLPLPGAVLPEQRIVCYYGNPNSKGMGALGQYPKEEMLRRLMGEVQKWSAADPEHPALPCLHMVAVVAQGAPGTTGHYRSIMFDKDVKKVYEWAKEVGGIFFVDLQVGTDDVRNILPRFEWILKNPDVHLAVDPEFYMQKGTRPGSAIGTMRASDINYVTDYVADLVRRYHLPPKVVVIHRFTRGMVTDSRDIELRPEVQLVMDMDGWGAPWLKRDSYRDYIVREPVQFTGFKLFYDNDTKAGDPLMQPEDLLQLRPRPLYIQYQ